MWTTGTTLSEELAKTSPILEEAFKATILLIEREETAEKKGEYGNLIDFLINMFSFLHPEANWWLTYRRAGYIQKTSEGYLIPEEIPEENTPPDERA